MKTDSTLNNIFLTLYCENWNQELSKSLMTRLVQVQFNKVILSLAQKAKINIKTYQISRLLNTRKITFGAHTHIKLIYIYVYISCNPTSAFLIYFILYVTVLCLHACLCAQSLIRPKEGADSCSTRIIGSCKLPCRC